MTNDNLGNQHFAQDQCEQNNISGGQQTNYRNVQISVNYIVVADGRSGPLTKDFPVLGDRLDSSATSKWLQNQLHLYSFKHQERHTEVQSQIIPGTGQWILDTKEVKMWQDDSHANRHLLLQGASPSLKSRFESSPYGDNLIRPIEYISLFIEQCSMFKTVYVVIDALDAHLTHRCDITQEPIYESFRKLPSNVRVLFSSRDEALANDLGVRSRLRVVPRTADIEAFLLAKLHLNRLETDTALRTLDGMLSGLAINKNGLAQAFKPSFDRIIGSKPSDQSLARHILAWAIYSKQDLARDLLLEALEISRSHNSDHEEWHLDANSLLHACCGLVILDPEKGTFRLIHDSIGQCKSVEQLQLGRLETEIARVCLESLLGKSIDNCCGSLLSYSASFWALHLRSAGTDLDMDLDDLTKRFLLNTPKVTRALGLVNPGCETKNITGLHAAVFFDMPDWIRHLGKYYIDLNQASADGKTALHWAVAYGRRDPVIELLALGAKPNIQDSSSETPLHKLPRGSTEIYLDIAHHLIKHGADVTKQSKGQSPLSLAIRFGPTPLARLFIESQNDVNTEISSGWTSLRELFSHGYDIGTWLRDEGGGSGQSQRGGEVKKHLHGLLDLLLERGARLNEAKPGGWLPLPAAVRLGSASIVEKLLRHQPTPADSNLRDPQNGETPLRTALTYNRRKEAQLLLEHGSNVNEENEDGWKPLIHLCEINDQELVHTVIEKKARLNDIDRKGLSALSYAVKNNNKDITWLLATKGADVNIPGPKSKQNIERALEHDDYSIAWLLCEHGAAVEGRDEKDMTLLHHASRKRNLRQVQFLMDRGLTLTTGDQDGQTPLHHAVEGGSEKVVHLLASRNTEPRILDKPDHNGTTALMLATLKMNFPMVRILLRHGASCELKDHKGMAPIHSAAQLGWLEGLRAFVQQVKDVNMTDNMGNTAVHRAVYGGKVDIIRYLADEKASLEVLNNSGCSPLMAAVLQDSPDIVWALLQAGANIHRIGKNGCSAIDFASYRGTSKSMNIFQKVLKLRWSPNESNGS
ncbi:ankyrin [Fusarium circinatum]|uniref:Ankyrin n=1 Tax=Fusarium circinatum TaxID=48490 RepID=A0A8H5SX79_FUSCI|nr:ankyrin [Fusarium circinatum]